MAKYTIKDLETLTGIKAHTIRIWEKRYQIVSPKRTDTNIRYYDDEDLKHVLNVAFLNKNGIKISKIAHATREQIKEKIESLTTHQSTAPDSTVDSLVVAMIELDENKFNTIFDQSAKKRGVEPVFIEVIYPFLKRIGVLWQVGTINPAQEHFVSNLIRQKLLVAIDSLKLPPVDAQKFLLFLPEGELHELGLLFYFFLLRKRGLNAIYLGQTVPQKDVGHVAAVCKPDFLVTSMTIDQPGTDYQAFVRELEHGFPQVKIIWSGQLIKTKNLSFASKSIVVDHVNGFIDLIDAI